MESELPTIQNYLNSSSQFSLGLGAAGSQPFFGAHTQYTYPTETDIAEKVAKKMEQYKELVTTCKIEPKKEKPMADKPTKRIVQIFIADSNDNVPADKALLYSSPQPFFTDATDQELFFGIGIVSKLEKYNEVRQTFRDKKASSSAGKDIFLEPLRIRDLKMVISTLAEF